MINNSITLEEDFERCKELYNKLGTIIEAQKVYESMKKTKILGNQIVAGYTWLNNGTAFASEFNNLIIEYVTREDQEETEEQEDEFI